MPISRMFFAGNTNRDRHVLRGQTSPDLSATAGQFTAPTSVGEGNEKFNQFRNPSFVQTDMTIYKNTHITERLNFQMRFEFFNLFNHANFQNIQGDLSAGSSFGKVTSQTLPRWWQIGGKLTF